MVSANLLCAQVLMSRAIKCLIIWGDNIGHLVVIEVERVHVLLELEVHWTFIHTALVILK